MKAVILAAGRGTRLRPLTQKTPKALLSVQGKTLIEHNLEKLPKEVKEVIIVINYLGAQIKRHLGEEFRGRRIRYVEQPELLGTGQAVQICEPFLKDRFLVFMGDDIYDSRDFEVCLNRETCLMVKEMPKDFSGDTIRVDKKGFFQDITEGDESDSFKLANIGLYMLDQKFFDFDLIPLKNKKEFGLPHTLVEVSRYHPIKVERANFWHQVNSLEDFESLVEFFGSVKKC